MKLVRTKQKEFGMLSVVSTPIKKGARSLAKGYKNFKSDPGKGISNVIETAVKNPITAVTAPLPGSFAILAGEQGMKRLIKPYGRLTNRGAALYRKSGTKKKIADGVNKLFKSGPQREFSAAGAIKKAARVYKKTTINPEFANRYVSRVGHDLQKKVVKVIKNPEKEISNVIEKAIYPVSKRGAAYYRKEGTKRVNKGVDLLTKYVRTSELK